MQLKAFEQIQFDQKLVDQIEEDSKAVFDQIKAWSYYDKTLYREHVTAQKFRQEGNKFHGIYGEIVINANLHDVLAAFIGYGQVTPESPLQVQKSTVFQKFYFLTEEDKRRHDNMVSKTSFETFYFVTHNCTRSPVPMIVNHRDAVCISVMRFVSPTKSYLYSKSFAHPDLIQGVVRAQLHCQMVELEETEPNKVKIDQYVLCDPQGMLPALIFNACLDERNNVLLLLKAFCEGQIKPEFGVFK